ncbi:hypothetical protein M431DRAFT_102261, partial [Trichoderma harzianum CBS 226.95]
RKREKGEVIKLTKPEPFDRDPRKIDKFFSELSTYFGYFPHTLRDDEDRVIFAGSRLTEDAETWFRPIMQNYEEGKIDLKKLKT